VTLALYNGKTNILKVSKMDYPSKTKSFNFHYFAPPIDTVIDFAVNLAVKRKFAYSSTKR
jgi:hypothetical protein